MFNFDVNGLVDQLKPAVEAVAGAMGTTATNLWTWGVQAMIAKEAFAAILALISLVGMCGVFWGVKKILMSDAYEKELPAVVLGIVGGGVTTTLFLTNIYDTCMYLLSPQYMLIMEILNRVK